MVSIIEEDLALTDVLDPNEFKHRYGDFPRIIAFYKAYSKNYNLCEICVAIASVRNLY